MCTHNMERDLFRNRNMTNFVKVRIHSDYCSTALPASPVASLLYWLSANREQENF